MKLEKERRRILRRTLSCSVSGRLIINWITSIQAMTSGVTGENIFEMGQTRAGSNTAFAVTET